VPARPYIARLAEQLVGPVGDHLVRVHVGLRAGSGLPDRQVEVRVEPPFPQLAGSLLDGRRQRRVNPADNYVRPERGQLPMTLVVATPIDRKR
jgi:hypothetical protein